MRPPGRRLLVSLLVFAVACGNAAEPTATQMADPTSDTSTSSTSSTSVVPATTIPPDDGSPADSVPSQPTETVLSSDGLGAGLSFGTDGEAVVSALVAIYGPPTADTTTELVPVDAAASGLDPALFGDVADFPSLTWEWPWFRETCWDMLCVAFASTNGESWSFEGYEYSIWRHPEYESAPYGGGGWPAIRPEISTAEGLTVGSTFAELWAAHPDSTVSWGEGQAVGVVVPGWEPNYRATLSTSRLDIGAADIPGWDYDDITPAMVPSDARLTDFTIGNLPDPTCC